MILDTSFLLDLKDGDHAAFERATELYETETIQRIALPSVMELHYDAAFVKSEDERRRSRTSSGCIRSLRWTPPSHDELVRWPLLRISATVF